MTHSLVPGPRVRDMRPYAIVVSALAVILVTRVAGGRGTTPLSPVAAATPASPAEAIAGALRVTVMIEGDGVFGAGFLIDPAHGTILTNYHVVQDMHTPRVTDRRGRSADAKVLGSDARLDLAVLVAPELATPGLQPPRLADASTLRPGDEVYTVGNPRKLGFTVSRGVVSYVGRDMEGARYLQLDLNINDGNSGGPVLTSSGEIVGVMSFIMRHAQGLSFALPVTDAAAAFPAWIPAVAPAALNP